MWAYPLITLLITGSAVFPPFPSESTLVTGASLAAAGELDPVLVALAAGLGSMLGDLVVYAIGRWGSDRARSGARRSPRVQSILGWLEDHRASWLPAMVVAGRFVPGGATAIGLAAGVLQYPLQRFVTWSAVGAGLWTGYGFGFALVGRSVFPDSPWATVLVAVALALSVTGVTALVQRVRARDDRSG